MDGGDAFVDPLLYEKLRNSGCRMSLVNFDPSSFFSNTPLHNWVELNLPWLEKGPFWYSHVTDLFRLAALWKYGGWYIDTDIVVLKEFFSLRNCLAYQLIGDNTLNNAISHFEAGHPFLAAVMEHITLEYNIGEWVSAGPGAVTSVLRTWEYKNCPGHKCVNLLPYFTFYPFGWDYEGLMSNHSQTTVDEKVNASYAIHFWNKITSSQKMHESSIIFNNYKKNCKLCLVLPDTASN
jgi:lactosylceramide 4-alpha-galactosyltransferase